jgi:hypothetical protein
MTFLFLLAINGWGQEADVTSAFSSQWLETLAEEGIDVEGSDELEELQFLMQHPLNLNEATQQTLEPFFFLTDIQIQNLLFFRDQSGPMLTVYELQGVKGFTENTIQLLLPFITIAPVEKRAPLTGFQLARWQSPFSNEAENTGYLGNSQKWFYRSLLKDDKLAVGFAMEKDASEPAFNSQLPFTDHYALFIQASLPKSKGTWVIGDYRLSFGQGLALSLGSNMSRIANPAAVRLRSKPLKGYASSDELRYLRGASMQYDISKRLSVVPFVSFKKIDASYNNDSSFIESISTTGYHRTEGELAKRHDTDELLAGLTLVSSFKRLKIEGGGYHYRLSKPLSEAPEPYQLYRFSGQACTSAWLAYTVAFNQLMAFGEVALTGMDKIGISQGVFWEPDGKLSISLRYQQFDNGYFSPYMAAGARSSDPSGERNFYAGLIFRPLRNVEMTGYILTYRYRWLRYLTDLPSSGNDGLVRLHIGGSRRFTHEYQVKYRYYEKNSSAENASMALVVPVNQYNFKWQGTFNVDENWRLATRLEYCRYHQQNQTQSEGSMMYQDVCYKASSGKWQCQLRYLLFGTDDYNSRIYTYEPDVRYGFSVPAWSGDGSRWVLSTRWSPNKVWDFWIRCAMTARNESSNSVSRSADIRLQLMYNIWHHRKNKM